MPKHYKGKSSPKEDKVMKNSQTMSPLASAIKPTSNEVYAVAAQNLPIGSSADVFDFVVKDIPIDPKGILSTGSALNDLVEAPIEELIKAYATARGYVTSTTYTDVSTYVYKSLNLFSVLLHMFRAQNVRNVQTPSGIEVGKLLSLRPSNRYGGADVADYIINGSSVSAATDHIDDGAISISNLAWSADWLSELTHIKLSEPMVKWAVAHFGVFYQLTTDGSTTMYSFIPEILTNSSGVSVETRFNGLAADLATLRSSHPDLVDILNFLGFTNTEVIAMDFTRDSRKLTLPIIEDEFLDLQFVNTNLYGLADDDSDVSQLFFDINGKFNALNYSDDVQLNADVVFASRYMRNAVFEHNMIKRGYPGGDDFFAFYPFGLSINVSVHTVTQARADRLAFVTRAFGTSGLPSMPYSSDAYVSDFGGTPTISSAGLVTSFASGTSNIYQIPETFDFYIEAKRAEMIMGNVPYRTQLQNLSNAIRTSSITKAS
jgi:hypothetical protein